MPVTKGILNLYGAIRAGAFICLADVTASVFILEGQKLDETGKGLNINSNTQSGYLLEIFIPSIIPFDITDIGTEEIVRIDGQRYKKIQIESNERIFPQQTTSVFNDDWFILEYEMNEDLFSNPDADEWKFILTFYRPDSEPVVIKKPWNEMHEY